MTETMKNRAQFQSPATGRWIKVNIKTGKMISIKQTKGPYNKIPILDKWHV